MPRYWVEKVAHAAGQPGAGVHAIGHVTDGDILFLDARVKEIPHFAADMAMKFGNRIGALGKFERQDGHDKHITPGLRLAPEVNEFVAG